MQQQDLHGKVSLSQWLLCVADSYPCVVVPETQDLGIREVPDAEALAIETGLRMEEVLANVEALHEKVGSLWRAASAAQMVARWGPDLP